MKYFNQRCDKSLELPKDIKLVDVIIVIPCYKESWEGLSKVYASLKDQDAPNLSYNIVSLINYKSSDSSHVKEASKLLFQQIQKATPQLNTAQCKFYVFEQELEGKKAGVGFARKKLMDFAFRWFLACNPTTMFKGIIVNLDADTTVARNYISEIVKGFSHHKYKAASIAFEHPLDGFSEHENSAIVNYELHLRYFINMQRWVGLPFAYQTVGSAMAVRASAYVKVDGMNTRQAGEDFYFMQKFCKNNTLGEINTTKVFPSARKSDRVPFGTGRAILEINDLDRPYTSYALKSFVILRQWLKKGLDSMKNEYTLSDNWYTDDTNLTMFLSEIAFRDKLQSIFDNSIDYQSFVKKFFQFFDAFILMKYCHFMRAFSGHEDVPIDDCIEGLFDLLNLERAENLTGDLRLLRDFDLKNDNWVRL